MGKNSLSRRNFLKGGVAAAAIGGLSMAGCANSSEVATADGTNDANMPESWDHEADIVILGSGCAGMYAAVEVDKQGSSVLILEAAPPETAGGATRCSGGVTYPRSVGAKMLAGAWSYGETSQTWADEIEKEGVAAIDWLYEHGNTYLDEDHWMTTGRGAELYETILRAVDDAGIEVLYETPAKSLILSQDGEVRGVKAGADGNLNVKAKKAVLIFTGDYLANEQLMSDFHLPGFKYYSLGSPYAKGDGLLMAAEIGARIGRLPRGLDFGWYVSVAASEEVGSGIVCNVIAPSTIYVNGNGERFINEKESIMHNKSTLPFLEFNGSFPDCTEGVAHYVNDKIYEIVDQACFDSGCLGNAGHVCSWAVYIEEGKYEWSMDNQVELEKGWIIKADTLDELAQKLELDPQTLNATVAEYNADCEAGVDKFGRDPESLGPIGEGPYYAIELGVGAVYTIGGLMTDDTGCTLNWRNEPISRLYSGGNVGMSGTYLTTIGINGSMAQGILAAKNAVKLDPWDAA